MDVKETVLAYFRDRGLPEGSEAEELATSYLELQLLDSLEIVTMIVQLEQEFGIRFRPEDLEDPEFGTIGGLIGIVGRARAAAEASPEGA